MKLLFIPLFFGELISHKDEVRFISLIGVLALVLELLLVFRVLELLSKLGLL